MGFEFRQTDDPGELLTQPVKLTEVMRAYSILAAGGDRHGVVTETGEFPTLNVIQKVWDENGNLLLDLTNPDLVSIISAPLAYLVNQPLSDDIARQPSLGYPNVLQLGTSTASKIGVDPAKQDTWTVGYTSERVVGVWLGARNSKSTGRTMDFRWTAGIWRAAMDRTMQDLVNTPFLPPAGVTTLKVCSPSGYLPTDNCPGVSEEIFAIGSEPNTSDPYYQKLTINRETGRLATVFTPPELAEEKVFLDVPAEFIPWAKSAGLEVPPKDYDVIQSRADDPAVHFSSPVMYAYVNGKIALRGTASSQDFSVYRIQIGEGLNPRSWQQVGQDGRSPVIEGPLGELDTTGLNGLYVLRLQVIDTQNRIKSAYLQVTVDNEPPIARILYPTDGQVIDPTEFAHYPHPGGCDRQCWIGTCGNLVGWKEANRIIGAPLPADVEGDSRSAYPAGGWHR